MGRQSHVALQRQHRDACCAHLAAAAMAVCCCAQLASTRIIAAATVVKKRSNRCHSADSPATEGPDCPAALSCTSSGKAETALHSAGGRGLRRDGSYWSPRQAAVRRHPGTTQYRVDAGSNRVGAACQWLRVRVCRLTAPMPQQGCAERNILCIAFTDLIVCACSTDPCSSYSAAGSRPIESTAMRSWQG